MRFYIDFENVTCGGLKGIENLKESDIVVIYYSNDPNINMETIINMIQSKAKIEFQKLSDEIKKMNLKNALDIVILNDISRMLNNKSNECFIIVSNDSGYDSAINNFSTNGKNVKRASSISTASQTTLQIKESDSTSSEINEQEVTSLLKKELSGYAAQKQEIITIIKSSKTRCQINNALSKKFHNKTGEIMKVIKPYIKQLPGQ